MLCAKKGVMKDWCKWSNLNLSVWSQNRHQCDSCLTETIESVNENTDSGCSWSVCWLAKANIILKQVHISHHKDCYVRLMLKCSMSISRPLHMRDIWFELNCIIGHTFNSCLHVCSVWVSVASHEVRSFSSGTAGDAADCTSFSLQIKLMGSLLSYKLCSKQRPLG